MDTTKSGVSLTPVLQQRRVLGRRMASLNGKMDRTGSTCSIYLHGRCSRLVTLSPLRSSRAETIPIQPTRRRWRAAISGLNILPASPLMLAASHGRKDGLGPPVAVECGLCGTPVLSSPLGLISHRSGPASGFERKQGQFGSSPSEAPCHGSPTS